jgi:hypothetical protein
MKRFLPTLLLVILCIGGFWFAASHSFFKKPEDKPVNLVTANKDDVQSFTIKNNAPQQGETPVITLEKKDGKWAMTQPAAYPLNTYSPDSWVSAITSATGDKKIEENVQDLSKYGLDKPKEEFQIVLKDGTRKTLLLGDATPVTGTYYVKTDGSSTVYQMSQENLQSLQKQPIDMVEKDPFQFDYNKLKSLTVQWKGQEWTLTKSDLSKMAYESDWKLGDLSLSSDDGTAFLDKMINFASDQLPVAASTVKVDNPELTVKIVESVDGKDVPSTYVGKIDGGVIWIVKQGGPWAYSLNPDDIQQLYDKAQDTRDKVAKEKADAQKASSSNAGSQSSGSTGASSTSQTQQTK